MNLFKSLYQSFLDQYDILSLSHLLLIEGDELVKGVQLHPFSCGVGEKYFRSNQVVLDIFPMRKENAR